MTDIKQLVMSAAEALSRSDAPEFEAYELVKHVFGVSRTDILLNHVTDLTEDKVLMFDELVKKRSTGYPLQYILGEWDFYGFTFKVNEGVLIPRNETEQIADEACRFLKNKKDAVIFDLCSGSGCIGLSVAANNPDCRVYLFDISRYALECSKTNQEILLLDNAVILDYDIFNGFDSEKLPAPDVLLSNPPYVTETEFSTLEAEIFHEPKEAIVADGDGLVFYRAFCEKWLPYLKKDGFFMFESGEGQPEKIIEMINGGFDAKTENDMYGVCRFVSGVRRSNNVI